MVELRFLHPHADASRSHLGHLVGHPRSKTIRAHLVLSFDSDTQIPLHS